MALSSEDRRVRDCVEQVFVVRNLALIPHLITRRSRSARYQKRASEG
jgi:hypothetical protein